MKDKSIRIVIFDWLEENFGKMRIFEESPIGKSRCDFYVVTDKLTGFEIKSDADSYERLSKQVKNYDLYFDQNYIVVGEQHKKSVVKKVPDHWGILCVSDEEEGFVVKVIRRAVANPKIKREKQMTKLWHNELTSIAKKLGTPLYLGQSKTNRIKGIMKHSDDAALLSAICEELFERDYTNYQGDEDD